MHIGRMTYMKSRVGSDMFFKVTEHHRVDKI